LLLSVYAQEFSVEWKGHDDPVTAADRGANELLIAQLNAAFPDDSICAEESPLLDSAKAAGKGGRCWFVDPLDGTKEFIRRSGEFCVMVGLAIAGRAALGVLVAPVWRRTFIGIPGQGAYELGADGGRRPLRVRPVASPAQARLVVSRLHRNRQVERTAARLGIDAVQQCGSTGLKFIQVATGAADLYLHTGVGPRLWDGCAPEAIARAAGAEVIDAQGRPLRYDTERLPLDDGLVVAAPALAGFAAQLLREELTERPL
jgi:3'(2'), 5'-bisphosphate nucleotidase